MHTLEEHVHDHKHDERFENAHSHEHTHADGTTHTHQHAHYVAATEDDASSRIAMLEYMLDHNRHHVEELKELYAGGDDHAQEAFHEAIAAYQAGNDALAHYIAHL